MRQLNFDQPQVELLTSITPGAALRAAESDAGLKLFLKRLETTGLQLAHWNIHPNRIASAFQDYHDLVWRDGVGRDASLKSVFNQLQFGILLRLNRVLFKAVEDVAAREQRVFDVARRMLQVEENERRRISRELHDDAGQSLVVMRLQMEMIELSLPPDAESRQRLAEVRDITEATILHMRRLIADLSPPVMEQLGLAAGLRQLITRFRRTYPCSIRVHIGKLPELPEGFQNIVYRLAQECLKNISLHSQAAHVAISVKIIDKRLQLRVEDDGVGFDVEKNIRNARCFGLQGMQERVALLGGTCRIQSAQRSDNSEELTENSGTEIDIRLPILLNIPSTLT